MTFLRIVTPNRKIVKKRKQYTWMNGGGRVSAGSAPGAGMP